jgi:hypothetical protein
MNAPVVSPACSGARGAVGNREARRARILALVQAGWTYAGIAREEGLSRERVRQIVAQPLGEGAGESKLGHALAPIARREPALRLAARGGADGDLRAIDRLLKALERLDQYGAVAGADTPYDENALRAVAGPSSIPWRNAFAALASRKGRAKQAPRRPTEGMARRRRAKARRAAIGALDAAATPCRCGEFSQRGP